MAIYGPSVATEVFPICYHPPPPGIGGLIRHINIHTSSVENIKFNQFNRSNDCKTYNLYLE